MNGEVQLSIIVLIKVTNRELICHLHQENTFAMVHFEINWHEKGDIDGNMFAEYIYYL